MQLGKHYEVTLDRDATSFLGLTILHNPDGTVLITQPKLLTKLFALYPPLRDTQHKPIHPYPPLPKDSDPPPQPTDHYGYLRLLGILLYLTKSRPDIMAAVSFAGTKSNNPTDRDHSDLYYVVDYLRATPDIGSTEKSTHPISSTRTARATPATPYPSTAPQIDVVEFPKDLASFNLSHTYCNFIATEFDKKPLRSSAFPHMAHKILGQPTPTATSTPSILVDESPDSPTEIVPLVGMDDVTGQPSSETKRGTSPSIYLFSCNFGTDGGYGRGCNRPTEQRDEESASRLDRRYFRGEAS
eukprot:gene61804-biopygen28524